MHDSEFHALLNKYDVKTATAEVAIYEAPAADGGVGFGQVHVNSLPSS